MKFRAVLTTVALLAAASFLCAQQAPPTFRSGVDAVSVDAFVTDAQGNPVPNLTIADFAIAEDGTPQRITSFSEVNIPIRPPEAYSPTAAEPDVATNTLGEGRLYAIVFDDLKPVGSLSGDAGDSDSPAGYALRARQFLRTFIERHFEPNDIGIVVSIGRARATDMQDFTSNRRLLLSAIDTYIGGFPAGGFAGVDVPPDVFEPRRQARALRDLMESLERIQKRRKAVLYITNELGESAISTGRANVWDIIDYRGGVRSLQFDDLRAALTAAMRGGVAFYTFDPTGADPLAVGSSENLERMDGLRKLSAATGGFAIVNSNGFTQAFPRLVAENSQYYVLGFVSSNEKRDGRYRQLQVRTKRPGLTVRFRDGYIAPSKGSDPPEPTARSGATLSPGVGESIRNPIARSTVPMSVFATAYRGPAKDANVVIAVELDASRLQLVDGPTTDGVIEVAAVAVSAAGKVTRGQREQFTLKLKPQTWDIVSRSGLRVVTGTTLPPGRYQLRVGAGNVAAPDAGSVMYDLEVPDFSRPPLALSGLTLTSRQTEAMLTVHSTVVKPVTPVPPNATRDFAAGDTLSVYAEVYDNRAKDAHRLDLVAELRDTAGNRVGPAVNDTRSNGERLQRFEATLPLDVPPGAYVLHVEARSSSPKQPPVSRDVPLRVSSPVGSR
jgi:VWFA-related protein